jgi:hypothetical protein
MHSLPIPGSIYQRGRLWWYKRQVDSKLLRVSTGMLTREDAIEWVRTSPFGIKTFSKPREIPRRFVVQLLRQAKNRARVIDAAFRLTEDDFQSMYEASGRHCAVSGIPFDLEQMDGVARRPYAPSIDRIDRMGGYTKDNCRIVCCAVNLAMNDFGETVLWEIASNMVEQRRKKRNSARNLAK